MRLVCTSEVGNIHPYGDGNMEVPGQGCGTGNGQDDELTEHIPERQGAWCVPGQEVTSSECDAGTSSSMNFPGGPLPGQRRGAETGPDPVGGGRGRGLGPALLAGVRGFQSSGLLTPRWSGLARCCDSPCQLHGMGRAAQA